MEKFIQKLKQRAKSFYDIALERLKNEDYDLAMFNFEQSIQLLLKSKILEFGIEFPKTHEISILLDFLSDKIEKIKELKEKYKNEIENLEEAYISSRYLPLSFSKEECLKAKKFAEELWKLLS
ncbi:MAG: HEPN domain-containing protein [Candidatus Aenigmatarchaeota archaeon]